MGDKLLYCPFIFSQFRRRRLTRAFFLVGERNNIPLIRSQLIHDKLFPGTRPTRGYAAFRQNLVDRVGGIFCRNNRLFDVVLDRPSPSSETGSPANDSPRMRVP